MYYMLVKNISMKLPKITKLIAVITVTLIMFAVSMSLPSVSSNAQSNSNYTTGNNKIYRNGKEIKLRGINWFGLETTYKAPHGIWQRSFKDMIQQMKSLGFNAVRVPFCPDSLKNLPIDGYVSLSANPSLNNLKSLDTMDRFLQDLNNNQMYILLDHHTPDCKEITELWYTDSYSEAQWINDLKFVASRYSNLDYFMGIDLKNEPHGRATWGKGNPATDWNLAAEKAGKAVLSVNNKLLIYIEGIADTDYCSSKIPHFWGNNLQGVKCKNINTNMIPKNKQIYSPHVYGIDVYNMSYFSDPNFPKNLPKIWFEQFGYLTYSGRTIVPGEFGTMYGKNGGNPKDKIVFNELINYFIYKDICNTFYWSWNPNSNGTGGILQDNWTSIWEDKLSVLKRLHNHCGN
jgi:endoglucanase